MSRATLRGVVQTPAQPSPSDRSIATPVRLGIVSPLTLARYPKWIHIQSSA